MTDEPAHVPAGLPDSPELPAAPAAPRMRITGLHHATLISADLQRTTAFYRDLAAHGRADDVTVVTWTEFSRRVEENANGSTDHGSAGGMIVLGNGVRQGIYGDQPSLTDLIDRGNLLYTVDFRSVYATLIEDWLGVPSADLMGQQWPLLPIFKGA